MTPAAPASERRCRQHPHGARGEGQPGQCRGPGLHPAWAPARADQREGGCRRDGAMKEQDDGSHFALTGYRKRQNPNA